MTGITALEPVWGVLMQEGWQTVTYIQARSTEVSVAENVTVLCSWDDACPGGSWSQQTITTIDDEVDVIRHVHMCLPRLTMTDEQNVRPCIRLVVGHEASATDVART